MVLPKAARRMFLLHWITNYPLWSAGALLVGAASIGLIAAWIVGGFLVSPAHRAVGAPPPELGATEIALASESGATIKGWWCESKVARATILLFHGVRGDRRSMLGRAKLFRDAGFSVLLIDFQAHGESRGSHITFGYLERHDVSAAIAFAKEKNPDHPIGIVGSSLGGAATLLGAPRDIDALVLEAVYPTIDEAVEDRCRMRLGPFGFALKMLLLLQLQPRLGISSADLRPIEKIADLNCPVLVTAGDLDRHTTLPETERLFAAACEPKELVIFRGAAHVDLLSHDPALYEQKILGFFQKCLLGQRPSERFQNVQRAVE